MWDIDVWLNQVPFMQYGKDFTVEVLKKRNYDCVKRRRRRFKPKNKAKPKKAEAS